MFSIVRNSNCVNDDCSIRECLTVILESIDLNSSLQSKFSLWKSASVEFLPMISVPILMH